MRKLFALMCLLTLAWGGVLRAQEQEGKDEIVLSTLVNNKEEVLSIKISAAVGDRFSIAVRDRLDTVEITDPDGIAERNYTAESIDRSIVLHSLDAESHIIGLTLEGYAYTWLWLSHCPNLRYLSLSKTSLESLGAFASLTLQTLKCLDNPFLQDMILYACPALQVLECSGNRSLQRLYVPASYELEELVCTHNDSLKELYINHTKLKALDLLVVPNLETVYCDHNRVESLLIDNGTALKTLFCMSNQLTSLKLPSDVILDWFVCDSNRLMLSNLADLVNSSLDVSVSSQLIPVLRQVGQTLDLHNEMSINNAATKWAVLDADGNIITNYTNTNWDGYRNGRFFFDKTGWYRIALHHDALSRHDGVLIPAEVFYDVTVVDSVARPVFSEPSGAVRRHTLISLSTTTPDARIYYTTDGSEPDSTASLYTEPIYIDEAVTIKAIAMQDTFASRVATASYKIVDSVARPVFSEPSGAVRRHTPVSLSTTTPDARIYYTTDGSVPDNTAMLYTVPISIDEAVTIKAIAMQGTFASQVATASYTVDSTANESDRAMERVRIYAQGRSICLSESVGEVEVFAANGQCVYRGSATVIPVKRSGLYVVATKGGRWKVAVR